MWDNFYKAGGWGMYPTSLFGFFLLAGALLYALRPETKRLLPLVCLAALTTASGALGTVMGVVRTFNYLHEVAPAEQLQIAAAGCAESLHNAVLALILIVFALLVALVGTVRAARST